MKFSKLIVASLGSIICLAGCSNASNPSVDDSKLTYVADFEQDGPDFNSIILVNNFGKVEKNSVQKFVKSGKQSALLKVTGNPTLPKTKPLMYFPLSSNKYDFNKADIRKYDSINFFIYNDSDKDYSGAVGFIDDVISYSAVSTAKVSDFTIKANSWNEYNFMINHSHLNLFFNLEETPALYFEFENNLLYNAEFAPHIYLDDVRFVNSENTHVISDEFELEENEICDFEKDFQQYFMSVRNGFEDQLTIDIVDDVDGIKASNGKKFLCINVKAHTEGWNAPWASAFLTEQYMRKTQMIKLDTPEEASQYRFCYDLRFHNMASKNDQRRVVTRFWSRNLTTNRIIVPCINENETDIEAYDEQWTTLGFEFCKVYHPWEGGEYIIDTNCTGANNTGQFEFSIGSLNYDYQILIDNIRLVKVSK